MHRAIATLAELGCVKFKVYSFNIAPSYTTILEALYKDTLLKHNIV